MVKRNILITGSSKGIGEQLARKFSLIAKRIILCSRTKETLYKVRDQIISNHLEVDIFICDLSIQKDCVLLAEFSNKKNIDLLINNAAISCPGINLSEYTIDQINCIINTNLVAPIILCKSITNLKSIINMNSIVGLEHKLNRTIYSASKWGFRGFSESLKLETNALVLDVYLSRVKTRPEFTEGLDVDFVANQIYEAFRLNKTKLILDGRPQE